MDNSCAECVYKKVCGKKDNYYSSRGKIHHATIENPEVKVQVKCIHFKKETPLRKFINRFL